jgi:hypothetical protein
MRPFVASLFVALLLAAPAHSGFVIRLEDKDLAATPNETIGIFLRAEGPEFANVQAQIRRVHIAAYIGLPEDVTNLGSDTAEAHFGSNGNFQRDPLNFPWGISIEKNGTFWQAGDTLFEVYNTNVGHDAAQATFETEEKPKQPPIYRSLPLASGEVKVGSFHIDATTVTQGGFTITLDDPTRILVLQTAVTAINPLTGEETDYMVSGPNSLRIEGGNFNMAHTPEPAVIGFAGLGATAALGWLRRRQRRRQPAA